MKKCLKTCKIILITLGFLILIPCLFYFVTFKTNFWTKYPDWLKSGVALSRLEASHFDSPICHEGCIAEREAYKKIVGYYLENDQMPIELIVDHVLEEELLESYRIDLLGVIRSYEEMKMEEDSGSQIKLPEAFVSYLKKEDGNMNVKRSIIDRFGEDTNGIDEYLISLISVIRDKNLSIDERIPTIWDLSNIIEEEEVGSKEKEGGPFPRFKNIDYRLICNLYMNVIEEKDNEKLRFEASEDLYYCIKFKEYYTEDIFNRLVNVLFEEDNHAEIQSELLYNIYLYKDINYEKTIDIVKKIYNKEEFNKFIKKEAAEYLTESGISGYPEPEISEEEWDKKIKNKEKIFYTKI